MKTKNKNLLIVFMKNPVKGKVKTRLAKKIGDTQALQIYKMLLHYTGTVIAQLKNSDKAIFYSDFIAKGDMWDNDFYRKYLQEGNKLGERMKNALALAFEKEYEKVIIIGTDCYELKTEMLASTFTYLDSNDVVIGPATDGGYYLLGMKVLHRELFENIPWSTANVLLDTINTAKKLKLTYHLLPALTDVDTEDNLNGIEKLKAK